MPTCHQPGYVTAAAPELQQRPKKQVHAHRGIRCLHLGDARLTGTHPLREFRLREAQGFPLLSQAGRKSELESDELSLLRGQSQEVSYRTIATR